MAEDSDKVPMNEDWGRESHSFMSEAIMVIVGFGLALVCIAASFYVLYDAFL